MSQVAALACKSVEYQAICLSSPACWPACTGEGKRLCLRHLRGRGEEPGAPEFRDDESSEQRNGDRLKQELINMAGKASGEHVRLFAATAS